MGAVVAQAMAHRLASHASVSSMGGCASRAPTTQLAAALPAAAAVLRWERVVRGALRVARRRRLWSALGNWLGEVRRRGRELPLAGP